MKTFGTLALALALSLSPVASSARADAWLLDIVSVAPGSNGQRADSYLGALDLVARRYGGVRVSRLRENGENEHPVRLVGLWRFPSPQSLEALVADPNYASIRQLRRTTIDAEAGPPIQLVADRSHSAR